MSDAPCRVRVMERDVNMRMISTYTCEQTLHTHSLNTQSQVHCSTVVELVKTCNQLYLVTSHSSYLLRFGQKAQTAQDEEEPNPSRDDLEPYTHEGEDNEADSKTPSFMCFRPGSHFQANPKSILNPDTSLFLTQATTCPFSYLYPLASLP